MATFKGAELVCRICSTKFKVPSCRAETATTCSHKCSVIYRAQGLMREQVSYVCKACGITVFTHKSHAEARVYCSNACKKAHAGGEAKRSGRSAGAKNGMWKGGIVYHSDGYVYENCPQHPFASNGYVFQHRLVVERHLVATNPDSACLIRLGENLYLNPALDVHHKNLVRDDNAIANLQAMTNSDHQKLHNRLRKSQRL